MKLWEKGVSVDAAIETFTVGNDRLWDSQLAEFDVAGSLAHAVMLSEVGLLDTHELPPLVQAMQSLWNEYSQHPPQIPQEHEDIHSYVEFLLTRTLGDTGKKIHTGRSRNDQVLVDMKLWLRDRIERLVLATESLANTLLATADRGKDIVIPGYTHLQAAMPSSFGLLFGGYAESLADDLRVVRSAWEVSNRNPLGSAAGYGSSFPLNRMRTTELLGFSGLNVSSVYAQMTRGKAERIALQAVASVAQTVGRMAMDVCLYTSQNFAFLSLPASFTTGSSIMPHKKNPDVFELIRAHCNRLQSYPTELSMMMANLPSGYHRDLQLVKEIVMPAFQTILTVLSLAEYAMGAISMNVGAMDDSRYDMVYSVENVNALVRSGMPFRDAYKAVAAEIESGTFSPVRHLEHSHLGSIGNPGLQEIRTDLQATVATFNFTAVRTALQNLRTFVPL